jgi:hypothetical protein
MARSVHAPQSVADLPLFAQRAVGAALALPAHHGGLRAAARSGDLETSHEAAKELSASGRLNAQCVETLVALVRYLFRVRQAPTSAELAGDDIHLRYQHARRLSDLKDLNLVERIDSKRLCLRTGRKAYPWRVTEDGMRRFREHRAAQKRQEG